MNGEPTRCTSCGATIEPSSTVCSACALAWVDEHPKALAAVFYDREGQPLLDVAEAMAHTRSGRRIADDWIELGGERVRVLTSYLIVEHGFTSSGIPYLFETVVIDGPDHLWVTRYPDEQSARAGHAIVLAVYAAGHTLGGDA